MEVNCGTKLWHLLSIGSLFVQPCKLVLIRTSNELGILVYTLDPKLRITENAMAGFSIDHSIQICIWNINFYRIECLHRFSRFCLFKW